jgi:hypothetical protein
MLLTWLIVSMWWLARTVAGRWTLVAVQWDAPAHVLDCSPLFSTAVAGVLMWRAFVACRMLHRSCAAGAWVVDMLHCGKGGGGRCAAGLFECVCTLSKKPCFLVMQELFADGHAGPLGVSSRHLEEL